MEGHSIALRIREELLSLADEQYRSFSSALIPTVDKNKVIGIRIPTLRKYAARLSKTAEAASFMNGLPHAYLEENHLHAFLLERINDYGECVRELDRFLPYVDNWSTCDSMRPKVFKAHRTELMADVRRWLRSDHPYTVRFAVEMMMVYFLGNAFSAECAELAASVVSDEYYVNMMIAWYFATALAKNWDDVISYIEDGRLPLWVHNKTIQKAIESNRVSSEGKAYLKELKR